MPPNDLAYSVLRLSGQVVMIAWAAFWTWFCASVAASEGGRSILFAGGIIAIAWAVTALAWWRPFVGGLVAAAAGLFAAWFFQGAWAWLLMAAPPLIAGLTVAGSAWARPSRLTPA